LGLLEFRAFEMPPHARMSLAQQLLLRTFVAWFWQTPYRQKTWCAGARGCTIVSCCPSRCGMILRTCWHILNRAGYPVIMDFFHPHFEFRFPIHGKVDCQGMEIELRQALEPWHVLGEEPGGGGTARYVDSSVERLQVKVSGMTGAATRSPATDGACPCRRPAVEACFVAGIRYRAWQPPSCLHPTIGVHAPLVTIDLFDTWSGRAVGGCTYHVGHPGGRGHDDLPGQRTTRPKGRRNARFVTGGHTPGTPVSVTLPAAETNTHFPYTLDLRRQPG
jgi:uncharacterized protein (DUF2126 family)